MKTRLAQSIGAIPAAELAAAMLCDVWSVARSAKGVAAILAASEPGNFRIDVPLEAIWVQCSGDLGARIEGILQRGLRTAPAAIALGADWPLVTAAHLTRAVDLMRSEDALIGPTDDGGFYLLGVRRCPPGLLAGISWSCEHTFRQTVARLQAHGMSVARLPTMFDVDTAAELQQLRGALQNLPAGIAPRTRKCLDEMAWSAS